MISFRSMAREDLDVVSRIEKETFKEPWTYEALAFELEENPHCLSFVAEEGGRFAAYAFVHYSRPHAHLVNIAVEKELKGRGIGSLFLGHLIGEAKEKGAETMVLEVREGNGDAINLSCKNIRGAGCSGQVAGPRNLQRRIRAVCAA